MTIVDLSYTTAPVKVMIGSTGPTGAAGAPGSPGATGAGVPTGGSTGQVLAKTSGADYATAWTTAATPHLALLAIGVR